MQKTQNMLFFFLFNMFFGLAQETKDTITTYKKRVLEAAEIDFLSSYYEQEGIHSAVGGGVGNERLTDFSPQVIIRVPLGDDEVLTVNTEISAYTSASSSNVNPFNQTGASTAAGTIPSGSPWVASSGASKSDVYKNLSLQYEHSSDDRNTIWSVQAGFATEYDYRSISFGGSYTKAFHQKNTEIILAGKIYLDKWSPIYPTELNEYALYGEGFLDNNDSYFFNVDLFDENRNESMAYRPISFNKFEDTSRNSFLISLQYSQILSERLQGALFVDMVLQEGLLSTPFQRVYFKDISNYFVGDPLGITTYTNEQSRGVYQLADDVERLPETRLKIPIGGRLNYYMNDSFIVRSFYRYYVDDWGVNSHTVNFEFLMALGDQFTVYPMYRYHTQQASDFFLPFDHHLSTAEFYTSDYDLSEFDSHQIGVGFRYSDIFGKFKIAEFGLRNVDLRYNYYHRSDGLSAQIFSAEFKFSMD